ncbi:hypothetical protein GCM10011614_27610 [Novosphingobium colocasiae]|uniref:IclR family transcriptional regulator n=2 Tax=Novosphingobium colocasiae TaxID=1256513 RepID=A0A918UI43_9SPHN|nr:hypothetical protein GCM10011614_27610 [Novosphingobium colocasiae]
MEVARALDLPQSSTSGLLDCLLQRGYLQREAPTRAFVPTARLALLGDWVQPARFRSGAVHSVVDRLSNNLSGSVILASLNGVRLWYVHATGDPMPGFIRTNTPHSPLRCAAGKALLSTIDPTYVRGLIHRLNAEADAVSVKPADFLATLDEVRANGYATSEMGDDHHMVAVLLPPGDGEALALGVVARGPATSSGVEQIVRHLRQAVSTDIGLSTAFPVAQNPRWSSVA